jgi:SAM-dependent methyltransferase
LKLDFPATQRNKDALLRVVKDVFPSDGDVLEVASGSGQHAVHFCRNLPSLKWQATDSDSAALDSINSYASSELEALKNMLPAVMLDVMNEESWPENKFDGILNCNMIHIAPENSVKHLFRLTQRCLHPKGVLVIYGPFFEKDVITSPSNISFDQSLQRRNSEWGIRHLESVVASAHLCGLVLRQRISMPAHNLTLVFGFPPS